MIIARMAESQMSYSDIQKIEDVISHGYPERYTIVSSSTWQDDLKDASKLGIMGNWHFIDNPIIDPSFAGKLPNPTYNVSGYLSSAWKALTDPTTTDPWVWGFHVRSLIHFIGDVHTPHHNCGLFSAMFPKGDMGGNLYTLNCNWGSCCNNIHFLWDSVGRVYPLINPTQDITKKEFEKNVSSIMAEYPEKSFEDVATYNPKQWSQESFAIANSIGYGTPKDETPSDDYMTRMRVAGKKRVAAAGYRLYQVLKTLASSSNIPSSAVKNSPTITFIWIINVLALILTVVFGILYFYPTSEYETIM